MRRVIGLAVTLTVFHAVHAKADNMKLTCIETTTCAASGYPTFNLANVASTGLSIDQTANGESLVVDRPRPSPTPEPASLVLFGSGLLTFGGSLLRRLKPQGRS
jgi:hypothetical protein